MSRFYEALKEASRSPARPNGQPKEGAAEVLEAAGDGSPDDPMLVVEEQKACDLRLRAETPEPALELRQSVRQEGALALPDGSALKHQAESQNGTGRLPAVDPVDTPMPVIEEQNVGALSSALEIPGPTLELPRPDLRKSSNASPSGSEQCSEAESKSDTTQVAVPPDLPVKPQIRFDPNARLITQAADAAVVEHYRRLRTKILQQHAAKPFKSLLVASANPEEGKTLTVLNLGLSFAMLPDFKVLIVDGDLRRGTIGKFLGADEHPGLNDLMEGTVKLSDVVLRCPDLPVHFVVRGNSKVPPAELLNSPHVTGLFQHMTEEFDLVLVDSPPVNLITDAQLLAGKCDAVLLIARAFSTTRSALEQAARELNAFRIIGTVLNGGTRPNLYRRYSGYY
jgi:capsular exopolysaccharide synthesis family protein